MIFYVSFISMKIMWDDTNRMKRNHEEASLNDPDTKKPCDKNNNTVMPDFGFNSAVMELMTTSTVDSTSVNVDPMIVMRNELEKKEKRIKELEFELKKYKTIITSFINTIELL